MLDWLIAHLYICVLTEYLADPYFLINLWIIIQNIKIPTLILYNLYIFKNEKEQKGKQIKYGIFVD